MPDVVLINPNFSTKRPSLLVPPLGLAYLASSLEQKGIEVKIIDASALRLTDFELEKELKVLKPAVVGVSILSPVAGSGFRTAQIARKHCKYLVLGGAHISALGGDVYKEFPYADYLVRGEGERALVELVNVLMSGREEEAEKIAGVLSKDFLNKQPVRIMDIDSLCFPSWHLLPMERYSHPVFSGSRLGTMITSRGCPYGCIFCDKSVSGNKWRARSPDNVLDELEELVFQEGVSSIIIYDDLFTLDKERVIKICKGIIERGLNLRWKCEGRVNLVDKEMLRWMKGAGCEIIAYGIETANQKGLDYLRKNVKVEEIKEAISRTRSEGIKVLGYFIFGIPVENFEDELKTIGFAKSLKLDYAQFGILSPFCGSDLYNEALSKGWYKEIPGIGLEEYGERRAVLITDYWDEAKLRAVMRRAYLEFYFSFNYIFRRLSSLNGLREFFGTLLNGLKAILGLLRG